MPSLNTEVLCLLSFQKSKDIFSSYQLLNIFLISECTGCKHIFRYQMEVSQEDGNKYKYTFVTIKNMSDFA